MQIKIIQGDITQVPVDVMVNAANSGLRPGSGVCGAIHRGAGVQLKIACQQLNGCETGSAKLTEAFDLL